MPAHPTKRHVELVVNPETRNPGLKKTGPGLHALSRSLCHSEACPVIIVVPRLCPGRKKLLAPPL